MTDDTIAPVVDDLPAEPTDAPLDIVTKAIAAEPALAERTEGKAAELTTKAVHAVSRMVEADAPATKAKRRRKQQDPHAVELIRVDGELSAVRARYQHIDSEIKRLDAIAKGPHTAEEEALIRARDEIGKQIGRLQEHRVQVLAGLWEPPAPPAPVVPKAAPASALRYAVATKEWADNQRSKGGLADADMARVVTLGAALEGFQDLSMEIRAGFKSRDDQATKIVERLNDHTATLKDFKALQEQCAALAAEVAELKARPTLKYVGIWSADTQFNPGEFCTDKGSLWHCNEPTRQRPGDGPAWRLAVKAGRDGKDAAR